eukprot:7872421-Alexandrium_andersonii.AAC.1
MQHCVSRWCELAFACDFARFVVVYSCLILGCCDARCVPAILLLFLWGGSRSELSRPGICDCWANKADDPADHGSLSAPTLPVGPTSPATSPATSKKRKLQLQPSLDS